MSMQNLEALKSLSALMDLIQNPAKYQGMIDGAKQVVEEIKQSAGHLQTVRDVQKHQAELEASMKQREDTVKQVLAKAETDRVAAEKQQQVYTAKIERLEAAVKEREVAVQKREEAVKVVEALKVQLEASQVNVTAQRDLLDKRIAEVLRKEVALKAALA